MKEFRTLKAKHLIALILVTLSVSAFAEKPSEVEVLSMPPVDVATLPDVNVTSLPNVIVSNFPTQPAPIVRGPFSLRVSKTCGGCYDIDYVVPAGKTLVVEYVSATVDINTVERSGRVSLYVSDPDGVANGTPANNQSYFFRAEATGEMSSAFTSEGWVDTYKAVFGQVTKIYLEEGYGFSILVPSITGLGNDGDGGGTVQISGYLIPSDSPTLSP
jgi:hypothetical protein